MFSTNNGMFFVAIASDGRVADLEFPDAQGKDMSTYLEKLRRLYPKAIVSAADAEPEHPVVKQVREYLSGERRVFELDVCLPARASEFCRSVWRETAAVPFGETICYGDLARRVGVRGAMRAVGGALGRNPLPILIPCHRVLRSDGGLGGFTGGLDWKRRLLSLEHQSA